MVFCLPIAEQRNHKRKAIPLSFVTSPCVDLEKQSQLHIRNVQFSNERTNYERTFDLLPLDKNW